MDGPLRGTMQQNGRRRQLYGLDESQNWLGVQENSYSDPIASGPEEQVILTCAW
jgi:hypothetical protein